MSFRMSCLLVEMPADAVVLASWIDETKTRKSSISLIGSVVGESATFDILSLANAGIKKCVDQRYPLLYPQITRSIELSY